MFIEKIDQTPEIKEFMIKFAKDPRGMLLLAGKNGTGKSYACRALYAEFEPTPTTLEFDDKIFINQAMLNIKWQEVMQEYGNTNYLLRQFFYPKLLILDDIGTRRPSDSFMDFLYAIVDHRYEHRETKATVITTNLNAAGMRQIFGDAFLSRVASQAVFRFEGDDRRMSNF